MKISNQLAWMFGLGLLSFTLVGVGMVNPPRQAQAAGESPAMCPPAAAPVSTPAPRTVASAAQGVGTGGAGIPLNEIDTKAFAVATASPKAPTSTSLVFMPLWARQ